jgi:hypothetical protein
VVFMAHDRLEAGGHTGLMRADVEWPPPLPAPTVPVG